MKHILAKPCLELKHLAVMAFFVPLLGFAGSSLFLNYQAAQQLENVGRDARLTRMFWPPFGFGILLGLWIGVSMGPKILGSIDFFEKWMTWLFGVKPLEKKKDQ